MTANREVSKGIVIHPRRLGGKPCITGTRIPAEMVANLTEGDSAMTAREVIDCYPSLSFRDISNARGWDRKGRPA